MHGARRIGIVVFEQVDLLDVGGPYEVLLTASRLVERTGGDGSALDGPSVGQLIPVPEDTDVVDAECERLLLLEATPLLVRPPQSNQILGQ